VLPGADVMLLAAPFQAELPTLIWMTTPVQHFATAKGEYDPKELGKQCKPLAAWYEVSTACSSA
jgi:hypothetical protein